MSYCRVRQATAPRRVVGLEWWLNPLYRGTDLRHRTIREREFVVDDRTDETSGRDEKDVGVHSCNCGVAEKSATRVAHAYRGENSREDRNPILYGNGALQGCAGARMVLCAAAIVQQQCEWYAP